MDTTTRSMREMSMRKLVGEEETTNLMWASIKSQRVSILKISNKIQSIILTRTSKDMTDTTKRLTKSKAIGTTMDILTDITMVITTLMVIENSRTIVSKDKTLLDNN
jgi:hypothetical protein